MKNRTEHKDYGKGVLRFGKYKGKTIKEIISNEDYGYIIWLSDNVRRGFLFPQLRIKLATTNRPVLQFILCYKLAI